MEMTSRLASRGRDNIYLGTGDIDILRYNNKNNMHSGASRLYLSLLLWRLHSRACRKQFLLRRRKVQAQPMCACPPAVCLAFRPQPPRCRLVGRRAAV